MLLGGQNNVFKKIPILTEARAIKHITSSNAPSSSSEGNTIQSSSSSQPKIASPPASCINYNPSTRTITISCNSARLTDINNKLHDSSILVKQPNGIWFLGAGYFQQMTISLFLPELSLKIIVDSYAITCPIIT
jgi:hypothetical protein